MFIVSSSDISRSATLSRPSISALTEERKFMFFWQHYSLSVSEASSHDFPCYSSVKVKFYDKFPSQHNDIPQNCSRSWYPVHGLTTAEIYLDICTIRLQLAQILGGDLGPELLPRPGQEHHRGGAHGAEAGPSLHWGEQRGVRGLDTIHWLCSGLHQLALLDIPLSHSDLHPDCLQHSYLQVGWKSISIYSQCILIWFKLFREVRKATSLRADLSR